MPEPTPLMPALTGSFSSPAGDNPTGAMVEAAYAHHGMLARYVNCDVPPGALEAAVRGAGAMGWIGFNLSLPHKQTVIPLLDRLAPSAELIGAVNCVVSGPDGLTGHNTDGQGFVEALRERVDPRGRRFTVLGAGGAARAICVEIALAGAASVTVVNRTLDRAEEVARVVREHTSTEAAARAWQGAYAVDAGTEVVVNATSIGLVPADGSRVAVVPETITAGMLVCDVIPNPPDTSFLREARERGAETLDGRAMLVNQAAVNVRLWTGLDPDRAVMHAALDAAIDETSS
ncbi:shikimate dehydrogenase family protein [Microbacterium sp. ASV49]|uniref:Shikimate dehydrogenase (NADP(+)) n=1 Tax=Microbacterium candidum TaxID=3041922 RepID=A0ABT7MTX7_9MICO|nr:shikimate dehydrogenase [Microbacterium sp. ASV49]MDL9977906.1 shikimate dehydrogenase [Microbacterium sp. ASV49]